MGNMEPNTENVIFRVSKQVKKDLLVYCAMNDVSMQDLFSAYVAQITKSGESKQRRRV
jgi:hypothetical protein